MILISQALKAENFGKLLTALNKPGWMKFAGRLARVAYWAHCESVESRYQLGEGLNSSVGGCCASSASTAVCILLPCEKLLLTSLV